MNANRQTASVAHEPPSPLPLEPEEERAALRRALSVEEADIVLRAECPALRNVVMTDTSILLRQGELPADGGVRMRMCVLSALLPDARVLLLYGSDWDTVLNQARDGK